LDIHEYISTGVTEAYVLGELPMAERLEFERKLAIYPELQEELRLAEETLEALARQAARAPRAQLKKQLIEMALPTPTREAKVIPINRQTSYWKWTAAASITFALLASSLAYTYRNRWVETRANLENLLAQNEQIARNYDTVNDRLGKIQNDLAIIESVAFRKVVMKGTENAPTALASVYWNETTQEVYLSIQNLKALAAENQFQLWAIVDGKPVDAGVFDVGSNGLQKMKNINGASAFAVTIEPKGGRPTPTLGTMQVVGSIAKS
jgi:anti-sigma-K factor RskA